MMAFVVSLPCSVVKEKDEEKAKLIESNMWTDPGGYVKNVKLAAVPSAVITCTVQRNVSYVP